MAKGFEQAVKRRAEVKAALMLQRARRRIVDARRIAEESMAAFVVTRAIRKYLTWLHTQRWWRLRHEAAKKMTKFVDEVRRKARRTAAARTIESHILRWRSDQAAQRMRELEAVRRRGAATKIQVKWIQRNRKRLYYHKIMVSFWCGE